jgi:hypothetical protein
VCGPVPMSETRSNLKHLSADMSKEQLRNVSSKYKHLPDAYYGGDSEELVTPDRLEDHLVAASREVDKSPTVKPWEWYSGSSSSTTKARATEVSHNPPIDYRYGWNLSKVAHQLQLLSSLLSYGTDCLFASPDCAPWGNDSRSSSEAQRSQRRACETSTLKFLATACFFQILLGRKYIIENSAHSDIFEKSPLRGLRDLPYHLALFDQCSCGPTESGDYLRKMLRLRSSSGRIGGSESDPPFYSHLRSVRHES